VAPGSGGGCEQVAGQRAGRVRLVPGHAEREEHRINEERSRRRHAGRRRRRHQRGRGETSRNCEPGCSPCAVPGREQRDDDRQGGPGGCLHGACRAKGDGRGQPYSWPRTGRDTSECQAEERKYRQIGEPLRQRQGEHRRAEGEGRTAQRSAWLCKPERCDEGRRSGDAHPEPGVASRAVQAERSGQAEDRHSRLVRVVPQGVRDLICRQVGSAVLQQQNRGTGHDPQRALACLRHLAAERHLPGQRSHQSAEQRYDQRGSATARPPRCGGQCSQRVTTGGPDSPGPLHRLP
jgi:hypothetical protein